MQSVFRLQETVQLNKQNRVNFPPGGFFAFSKTSGIHTFPETLFICRCFLLLVRNSSSGDYQAVAQTATCRPTCVFWPKCIGRYFAVWLKVVSKVCCLQCGDVVLLRLHCYANVSEQSRGNDLLLLLGVNIACGWTPSNAINNHRVTTDVE